MWYQEDRQEDISEGRKKTQVCHINRLKKYVHREAQPVLAVTTESRTMEGKEVPAVRNTPLKLKNSVILSNFQEKLSHLSVPEREDLEKLKKYPGLFSDVPRNVVANSHSLC